MVPVPSYQLLPFLDWLRRRGVRLAVQSSDFEWLHSFALKFLESQCSLTRLMSVFQECPKIREPDIEAQMEHFATCGQCIAMMEKPQTPLPRQRLEPDDLHPLLQGFVEWVMQSDEEMQVDVEVQHIRMRRRQDADLNYSDEEFRHLLTSA
jgi:hypothetical protein